MHPVIVGKRALSAMDLGLDFEAPLEVLLSPADMVIGFDFTRLHPPIQEALATARRRGALTLGLAGNTAEYAFARPAEDPFVCQELFEVLYHLLWESVHVYFEHRVQGHDVGAASFLYPFLGRSEQSLDDAFEAVHASVVAKVGEVNALRAAAAEAEAPALADAARAIAARVRAGGRLLLFGNGGSATDANDLAIDCCAPPAGLTPIPALSLAAEPANVTAIANDIGAEAVFARHIIAHGRSEDVAVAISTSGGSANLIAALAEVRRRGLLTVALVGYDGGRIVREGLADHALVVRSDYVPRIQEVQASLYHVLRRRLDDVLSGNGDA